MSEVLGSAYIEIKAITKGIDASSISKSLASAGAAGGRALEASIGASAKKAGASLDAAFSGKKIQDSVSLNTKAIDAMAKAAANAASTSKSFSAEQIAAQGKMLAAQSKHNESVLQFGKDSLQARSAQNELANASHGVDAALARQSVSADKVGGSFKRGGQAAGAAFSSIASQASGPLAPLNDIISKTQGMGTAFSMAGTKSGKALLGIGAAATGTGVLLMSMGSKDQAAQGQLSAAITGTGKSFETYKDRIEATIKTGEKYGYNAAATQSALSRLTMATHDPDKALKAFSLTMNMAASRHVSLDSAAQKLGRAMTGNTAGLRAYGISVDKSSISAKAAVQAITAHSKAVDLLKKNQQALIDMEAKLAGGRKGAGHASMLQIQVDTDKYNLAVKGASTALGKYGGNSDQYRKALLSQQVAQSTLTKAQGSGNVSTGLSVGAQISLRKAHEAVATAQAKVVTTTATMTAAQAKAKAGSSTFNQILSQGNKVLGGQAAAAVNTFSGRMKVLGVQIEDRASDFGQKFGGAITTAGPLLMGFGAIMETGVIQKLGKGAKNLITFSENSKIVQSATKAWTAVQWLFNAAMDANPVMLTVIAIAALGAIIFVAYKKFQPFHDLVDATGRLLKGAFVNSITWVGHSFGVLWGDISSVWNKVWGLIKTWGPLALVALAPMIGIPLLIFQHWSVITKFLGSIWDDVKKVFSSVFVWIKNLVIGFIIDEINGWKNLWNKVKEIFTTLWDDVKKVFSSVFIWIKNLVTGFVIDEINGWKNLWNKIKAIFTALWDDVKGIFSAAFGGVKNLVTGFVNDEIRGFNNLWNRIKAIFTGLWNDVTSIASTAWTNLKRNASTALDDFKGLFSTVVAGVKAIWNGIENVFMTPVKFVVNSVLDPLISGADVLLSHIGLNIPLIPHMAGGGVVPGGHNRDDVPFFGTPGEVVVPKRIVGAFGGPAGLMSTLGMAGGGAHFGGGGIIGAIGGALGGAASAVGGAISDVRRAERAVVKSAVGDVASMVGDAVGFVRTGAADALALAVVDPLKLVAKGLDHFGPVGAGFDHFMGATLDGVLKLIKGKEQSPSGGSYGAAAGSAAGGAQVMAWIKTALLDMSLPLTLSNGISQLISHESGGNPSAINLTDSNAAAGHPSQGLMQTIPSTFAAYVLPSLAALGITNPIANITAGVRYALANYGEAMLMAGGRHNSAGQYIGYAGGGSVPGGGIGDSVHAMLTPGEFVIPKNVVSALGQPFFESLRAQKFSGGGGVQMLSGGGAVQKFATGGLVKAAAARARASAIAARSAASHRAALARAAAAHRAAVARAAKALAAKNLSINMSNVSYGESKFGASLKSADAAISRSPGLFASLQASMEKASNATLALANRNEILTRGTTKHTTALKAQATALANVGAAMMMANPATESTNAIGTAFQGAMTGGSDLASMFNYQPGYGASSVATVLAALRTKVALTAQFNGVLQQLAGKGLGVDMIQQLIAAGPQAGMGIATKLLSDPSAIIDIQKLEAQLSTSSATLGQSLGTLTTKTSLAIGGSSLPVAALPSGSPAGGYAKIIRQTKTGAIFGVDLAGNRTYLDAAAWAALGSPKWTSSFGLGGLIRGASHIGDNMLIKTTPGEYVIQKSVVDALGVPYFDRLNKGNRAGAPTSPSAYTGSSQSTRYGAGGSPVGAQEQAAPMMHVAGDLIIRNDNDLNKIQAGLYQTNARQKRATGMGR